MVGVADGVPVSCALVPGRWFSRFARGGRGRVPRLGLGRVDIFHGTSFDVIPFRDVRLISTFYDICYLRVPETYSDAAREAFHTTVRSSLNYVDHIVTVSEHARRDLIEAYGIPEDRITAVYPAVTVAADPFMPTGAGTARADDRPTLLYVGEIGPRKNVHRLIDAFGRIAGGVPHDLILVGPPGQTPGYADALRRIAQDGGISGRVHFLGPLPRARVRHLLGACDAFAFPSLYEGFGFPVVEAMSLGRPTLTSWAGALPEIAADGALLVDPLSTDAIAEGLHELLTDASLRERLARKGQSRARLFSADSFVRSICEVYAKLV
jgi:glycosyltransferase involved in cell wall biosynthesis